MGRRNSLTTLINLQMFRHHSHSHNHNNSANQQQHQQQHADEPTKPTKVPIEKSHIRSSSFSTNKDDESPLISSMSSLTMRKRRNSTGCAPSLGMKSVRFGDCQIRSYPQVLGDHPYCSMGCPVELGWEHTSEEVRNINDFEEQRGHQRRQSREQLLLSPEERHSILALSENSDVRTLRKACRRQCSRKAHRKIQREFFAPN